MQYFQVKVQFIVEDAKGKLKKTKVSYLVDAMAVTEAEARMVKYLTDRGENEFEVKSVSESNISAVISASSEQVLDTKD